MNQNTFNLVRNDLYASFGHKCESAVIDTILDGVIAEHTSTARISDFLSILVARDAAEQIEDHLWMHGQVGTPRIRILFASRDSAPRAMLAAGLARELSDNAVVATVAKTHPENRQDSLVEWVIDERGLDTTARLDTVAERTLEAADLVVYLGVDETIDLPGRSYVQWDIAATSGMNLEQVRELADDLQQRIAMLLTEHNIAVETRSPQLA